MKTYNPGDLYYEDRDQPDQIEKKEMWQSVRRSLPDKNSTSIHIHWKSFWIGQAAAVLLILAVAGGFSLWNRPGDSVPAPENNLQEVYVTSLNELIRAQLVLTYPDSEQNVAVLQSQIDGLEELDRMIRELKDDMQENGNSQAKRIQLRRLYATKLDFVKKLILTEENSLL